MQIVHSDFQDQLVRGLAHRMNNILTLFHGYLGLLTDNKDLDKATLEGLAKIKQGAVQASELIDRTHALVRPSATVLREINLGEYLRLLRPSFEALRGPKTTLSLEIEEDLPPILADSSRFRTAIAELVKNACEATFANAGHVTISVRREHPKGSRTKWIVVSVSDNGTGVPEEIRERIFTPFFSTKKKQNAAGLGLTVALSFVQQHGGNLKFESEAGKTVFEFRLPAVPD
jgi:two-component system cell cycle sensor histidine kinase/response regulator CckA